MNRTSYFPNSSGLPGRPNKAYTWYLDNGLPWGRGATARSRASWNDRLPSLFGNGAVCVSAAFTSTEDGATRKWHGSGSGAQCGTWERVRSSRRSPCRPLETASALLGAGRLAPLVLSRRRGLSPFGGSPRGSQRSSPSPQGTLSRGSGSSVLQVHGAASLSPAHCPPLSGSSHAGGASCGSPRAPCCSPGAPCWPAAQQASARASFLSPWVSNSSSPSLLSSPAFSARSSRTSNGCDDGGDVSFGSETDDEFFYVSCRQVAQGLAGLSLTSSQPVVTRHSHARLEDRVVQNPSFAFGPTDDYSAAEDEDEDDFDGCSDDALSDDVFLDNPEPATVSALGRSPHPWTCETPNPSELSTPAEEREGGSSATTDAGTGDAESGAGQDGAEYLAVESLRRNSLQSRLRQTWRHRRHRPAAGSPRAATAHRAKGENAASAEGTLPASTDRPASDAASFPTCPSATGVETAQPRSLPADEELDSTAVPPEDKRSYYYVISPTDDVNMPEVIAVRRSSVELIRWQNSLRRRRRRQAKRHDLGRSKKSEPDNLSATA